MPQLFDIDAQAEAFEPVHIKFRGQEHVLGETVMSVLLAMDVVDGDSIDTKQLMANLPAILRTLCPNLEGVLKEKPLVQAEEVALLKPVIAVLKGFAALTKSDEEEEPT